jgi:hypothetical protein
MMGRISFMIYRGEVVSFEAAYEFWCAIVTLLGSVKFNMGQATYTMFLQDGEVVLLHESPESSKGFLTRRGLQEMTNEFFERITAYVIYQSPVESVRSILAYIEDKYIFARLLQLYNVMSAATGEDSPLAGNSMVTVLHGPQEEWKKTEDDTLSALKEKAKELDKDTNDRLEKYMPKQEMSKYQILTELIGLPRMHTGENK